MIRTLIIDDHKIFAEGLERLLTESGYFQIVEKFYNGKSLLENLPGYDPQLLIVDIELGGLTGLDLISRIRLTKPQVKIAMLSMHEDSVFANESITLGADGFLLKSMEYSVLINSLLQITQGKKIFPSARKKNQVEQVSPISDRELEILKQLVKGKTSLEISETLKISHLTVKTHRRNMMRKLKVSNVASLIRVTIERGYL